MESPDLLWLQSSVQSGNAVCIQCGVMKRSECMSSSESRAKTGPIITRSDKVSREN